jgi:cytochrome P450
MAARDTTASLISSVMYELARNATIQQELREEVYRSIGEDSPLTFEDVKQLPLLRAVINESLR